MAEVLWVEWEKIISIKSEKKKFGTKNDRISLATNSGKRNLDRRVVEIVSKKDCVKKSLQKGDGQIFAQRVAGEILPQRMAEEILTHRVAEILTLGVAQEVLTKRWQKKSWHKEWPR